MAFKKARTLMISSMKNPFCYKRRASLPVTEDYFLLATTNNITKHINYRIYAIKKELNKQNVLEVSTIVLAHPNNKEYRHFAFLNI